MLFVLDFVILIFVDLLIFDLKRNLEYLFLLKSWTPEQKSVMNRSLLMFGLLYEENFRLKSFVALAVAIVVVERHSTN